jgi:uncharacterized membrane protein YfcA
MIEYIILGGAALLAGAVDAVVGGGGLIQAPALFSALPNTAPATLLGTSKLAGIWGTGTAAMHYSKRVKLQWGAAAPAAITAFIFAFVGAFTVTKIPPDFMRKLLPFVLIAVAIYTWKKKNMGSVHVPIYSGIKEKLVAIGVGGCIGFYDGFFGPGTGSFLLFLYVRFFGFDFLRASAAAKVVNVACNFSALLWFGWSGHLLWIMGLTMAVFNVLGSIIGSRLAMYYGSGFIRKIFLVVVAMLIFKTGYDAFLK